MEYEHVINCVAVFLCTSNRPIAMKLQLLVARVPTQRDQVGRLIRVWRLVSIEVLVQFLWVSKHKEQGVLGDSNPPAVRSTRCSSAILGYCSFVLSI
jgi:hypothetical protein